MKNVKITIKLIIGFAIVTILTVIVGCVGIIGMKSISHAGIDLYEYHMRPMEYITKIISYSQDIRITLRDLTTQAGDHEELEITRANIEKQVAGLEENIEAYDKSIENPELRNNFDTFKSIYKNVFKPTIENMLEGSKRGDDSQTLMSMISNLPGEGAKMIELLGECMNIQISCVKSTVDGNVGLTNSLLIIIISVLAITVIVSFILTFYISSITSRPLTDLAGFFEKMCTTGDITLKQQQLEIIEEYSKCKDEIGRCIDSCSKHIYRLGNINEILGKIVGGDLTVSIEVLSQNDCLGISISKMIDSLNNIFAEMHAASEQVSAGAQQIAQGAQMLAAGSSEQSTSIEEFSTSLVQMEEKTKNNAENSGMAKDANDKTVRQLTESMESMKMMLKSMREINESSENITKIIKVIEDIAFQTNILALNAAVEAARAGQHGKGFAVVAEEVRNLASRSAVAAKETSGLIEKSTQTANEGSKFVEGTSKNLEIAVEYAHELSKLVDKMATDSVEQAKSIKEMNHNMKQIAEVVQSNSANAEESAAAAEEMSAQSSTLNTIVEAYKLKKHEPNSIMGPYSKQIQTDFDSIEFHADQTKY